MRALLCVALLGGCVFDGDIGSHDSTPTPPASAHIFDSPRWAMTIGNTDNDFGWQVGLDPDGNVFASGAFRGDVDFGGTVLESLPGGYWISKRAASDGHELWTRAFGGTMAVCPDGGAIVANIIQGDMDVGGQVVHAPASGTTLVAKYNGDGTLAWTYDLGVAGLSQVSAIAVASNGRIAVAGWYQGSLQLPEGAVTATKSDGFLLVLDRDGDPLWSKSTKNLGDGQQPALYQVVATPGGDFVVAGGLGSSIVFAGVTLDNTAFESSFLARFATDGQLLWAGVLAPDEGGVLTTRGENIVMGSAWKSDASDSFGAPNLEGLNPSGHMLWSTHAIDTLGSTNALTASANGTIYSGGGLDPDLHQGDVPGCMFLAAHDASGALLDVTGFGPVKNCSVGPTSLATRSGTLAMVGTTDVSIDLGTGPLRFAGRRDIVIAAFDVP